MPCLRILVKDAILYHEGNEERFDDCWCQIDILHSVNEELLGAVNEGDRIRLACLKSVFQHRRPVLSLKDLAEQRVYDRILHLETTNNSYVQSYKDFIRDKETQRLVKSFGNNLAQEERFSLEDIDARADEVMRLDLEKVRVDLDVVMVIVKTFGNKIMGITSNLRAVSIEIHDHLYFGKKFGSLSDKEDKAVIFQHVRLERWSEDSLNGELFHKVMLKTQENSNFCFKTNNNTYKEYLSECQHLLENSDKFHLLKQAIRQN